MPTLPYGSTRKLTRTRRQKVVESKLRKAKARLAAFERQPDSDFRSTLIKFAKLDVEALTERLSRFMFEKEKV